MKTRKETVDIEIHCDMKDCDEFGRYSDDLAPYKDGWRYIIVRVYDMYSDRTECEISMHICESCRSKLVEEPKDSIE